VIIGPVIVRTKVRVTETGGRYVHHYDIHSQTCRCNFMSTNEHPVDVGGSLRRSLLRFCATSRKVVGPIPDCVTGIFH
jgi:hypothetical protein